MKLKVKLRAYQEAILNTCLKLNTLVVLPTGLGKTLIGFGLLAHYRSGLFLAPTKPLVKQHYSNFLKSVEVDKEQVALITGEIKKEKRIGLYKKPFIFATPQTVERDIYDGISPTYYKVIIFDESHRAVGNYAYVNIAKYVKADRIVGLTASPGGTKERIEEIISNLKIEAVEIRTEYDKDVLPYLQKKRQHFIKISLTPLQKQIRNLLLAINENAREKLQEYGIYVGTKKSHIFQIPDQIKNYSRNMQFLLMKFYTIYLNTSHMLELLETQGLRALNEYIEKSIAEKKSGIRELLRIKEFSEVRKLVKEGLEKDEDHPKIPKLIEIVKKLKDKKGIIFSQYRDQVLYLVKILEKEGIKAAPFLGKKQGFNRKMQENIIKDFREGKYDVLVASSIGEEGIDIPSVDYVIFYDTVPSEIRNIQRRGRTARLKEGEIYYLITRKTRDEAFYWAAKKRERMMKKILYELKEKTLELLRHQPKDREENFNEKETIQNQQTVEEKLTIENIPKTPKQQKKITDFI